MDGGDGIGSGLSFIAQFTVANNGAMNFTSFQLLTQIDGGCLPVTGPRPTGTLVVTPNSADQVSGTFSLTVVSNGKHAKTDQHISDRNVERDRRHTGRRCDYRHMDANGWCRLQHKWHLHDDANHQQLKNLPVSKPIAAVGNPPRDEERHGIVAASPHQMGSRKSASRPSTVKTIQKILRSMEDCRILNGRASGMIRGNRMECTACSILGLSIF